MEHEVKTGMVYGFKAKLKLQRAMSYSGLGFASEKFSYSCFDHASVLSHAYPGFDGPKVQVVRYFNVSICTNYYHSCEH